ncbi:hypothetical protein F4679DRAFT_533984 [Xylaria curta]|nr:hypothetical protein F4679DRAFT_533984 [Xylaria curta]
MAIIQGFPGLEVTIFTGGRTAKEYDDPSETGEAHNKHPRVVTKYIECKDNEPFRIHLKATDEYSWGFKDHILNFGAVIDGVWAKGELCGQEYTKEEDWEREISYRVVKDPNDYARYILQEFAFSSIIKADDVTDEQHESDMETIERLGTIEVKVHRAIVQDNGSIFVPGGNHPKDFIISREAVKGRAKSHGTKFTRTQAAVKPQYIKCLALREDDGPIAIFRFKYRSREALILEGITPSPQQPFPWLVEISDDEKDRGKRSNFDGNNRNSPCNGKKVETKIKKEKEDNGIPSSASSTTGHNNNIGQVEQPQLKRFPVIKLDLSRFQNAASTHNISKPKSIGSRAKDPHRKLVYKDLAHKRDSLKKQNCADSQARLGATSHHNTSLPVTNASPQVKIATNSEPGAKQEVDSLTNGASSPTKRAPDNAGPQDKSRGDDNDIVQGIETSRSSGSCDIALPSIEGVDNAVEVKIKSERKSRSKSDKTVTQHTGKMTVIKHESPGSSPRSVNVAGVPRPELGTSNPTAQSLKSSPKTKDKHRKPTKLSKPKLSKEEIRRKIQELRRRKMDLKLSNIRRDGHSNVATPTTSFLPPTHTISATSLLKSMLPPSPPSSTNSHASTSKYTKPKVSQSLSYAAPNRTGMNAAAIDASVPESASKPVNNSRATEFKASTEAATHTDKETKIAPKVTAKRKIDDTRSIHRPCEPKKKKISK